MGQEGGGRVPRTRPGAASSMGAVSASVRAPHLVKGPHGRDGKPRSERLTVLDERLFIPIAFATIVIAMIIFHVVFAWGKCLIPILQMEKPRPREAEKRLP